jgi:hypothetical protein
VSKWPFGPVVPPLPLQKEHGILDVSCNGQSRWLPPKPKKRSATFRQRGSAEAWAANGETLESLPNVSNEQEPFITADPPQILAFQSGWHRHRRGCCRRQQASCLDRATGESSRSGNLQHMNIVQGDHRDIQNLRRHFARW